MEQTPVQSGTMIPINWGFDFHNEVFAVDANGGVSTIALVNPMGEWDCSTERAMVRLIAAAPDLLKVITAYVRYMDAPDAGTLDIEETLQRDMRAAIRKTTGGTL